MKTETERAGRQFLLEWNRGGIRDVYDTEYITPGGTLGEVLVGLRNGGGEWRSTTTFASGDIRTVEDDGSGTRAYVFSGDGQLLHGLRGLGLVEEFSQAGDTLKFRLEFRNETEQTLEIGTSNKQFLRDNLANYTQAPATVSYRAMAHFCSETAWTLPATRAGTKLEYYEEIDRHQTSTVSISFQLEERDAGDMAPTAYLCHAYATRHGGRSDRIRFSLAWAEDYDGVRGTRYRDCLTLLWRDAGRGAGRPSHWRRGMEIDHDLCLRGDIRGPHGWYGYATGAEALPPFMAARNACTTKRDLQRSRTGLHGLRGLGLVEEFSQAGDTIALRWRGWRSAMRCSVRRMPWLPTRSGPTEGGLCTMTLSV